ncbi:MAG: lysophospholipid acyltransferase family protein [Planctomycetes bacterium]|nr:lysophospholipid acyltransferase family protein [Planctomycetota bacterium]
MSRPTEPGTRRDAHGFRVALTSRVAGGLFRMMLASYRLEVADPTYVQRRARGIAGRCIYSFWHENLWHAIQVFVGEGVCVMVSEHRDGEVIARIVERMGYELARGSSTRGGAKAMRDIVRAAKDREGDLCFTVDGPKGPRREIKDGILFAASLTGLPIVPTGLAVARCWHTKSWDRMRIGKPFTRVVCTLGPEIAVPPRVDRELLVTEWKDRVTAAMDEQERRAEQLLARS